MIKVTNMTHAKDLNNAVQPIVLKINNVMLVFIRKKFVYMSAKNIAQYMLEKKENVEIVKTYHLNALLIMIIYI